MNLENGGKIVNDAGNIFLLMKNKDGTHFVKPFLTLHPEILEKQVKRLHEEEGRTEKNILLRNC